RPTSHDSFTGFRTNREENNNWCVVPFVYRRMRRMFATGASHINLEGRTSYHSRIILGTGRSPSLHVCENDFADQFAEARFCVRSGFVTADEYDLHHLLAQMSPAFEDLANPFITG